MPKRMLDGERLWRSDKLKQVKPESFRAEYANMLPLALANGTFECSPDRVRCEVYAFNRESFTVKKVAKILDEFERVKLLFRWTEPDGKVWGYWVGIEKTLPTSKQIEESRYKTGQPVPQERLAEFLKSATCSNVQQQASPELHVLGLDWIGTDKEGEGNGLESSQTPLSPLERYADKVIG